MRRLCVCLAWSSGFLLAQSPELGRIERHGDRATLIVESPRPVDSAAMTVAQRFGVRINAEDPLYIYKDDVEPSREKRIRPGTLIPKGGRLEVDFFVRPDGSPEDIRGLLGSLVQKANAQFPFAYRLNSDGDSFELIPTRTRDAQGRSVEITPLLDRRVTIPPGTRTIAETAKLMTDALSAQTGLRVNCCQGVVAGIPWGMGSVMLEAREEPARSVLKRLIMSSLQGQPNKYYWLQRCDPQPSGWCFINLSYAAGPPQLSMGTPPVQAETGNPAKWFDPK